MNKLDEVKSKVCEALELMEEAWEDYKEPTEPDEEWQTSLELLQEVEGSLQQIERILRREISQEFYDSFKQD